jgi:hypothetical protein
VQVAIHELANKDTLKHPQLADNPAVAKPQKPNNRRLSPNAQVDITSWRNKTQRVHTQVKDICAILSGLVVAQDYKRGQALVVNRNFVDNAEFFQVRVVPPWSDQRLRLCFGTPTDRASLSIGGSSHHHDACLGCQGTQYCDRLVASRLVDNAEFFQVHCHFIVQ